MADPRALAELLVAAFDVSTREQLAADPFGTIPTVAPLAVVLKSHRDVSSSQCSVEGLYRASDRLIEVLPAMSDRRTKFTTLHEFGHHLARNTEAAARALAEAHRVSPMHSRRLEERVADAFAAELLVPTEDTVELLDGRQPTAEHVRDLPIVTDGSREACCVRLAQHMSANGYVIVAEGRTIRFCAVVGDAYPVGRGVEQDDEHLLARAARTGSARQDQVRIRHRSGIHTREYGGHAVRDDDGYVYAVLSDATSLPWGDWRTPGDPYPKGIDMDCDGCGHEVEAWKVCRDCRGPICPRDECGWCSCRTPRQARLATKRCTSCQMRLRIDWFAPGSDVCKDCT